MSVCEVSLFALLYVHKGIRHRSLHFPFVFVFFSLLSRFLAPVLAHCPNVLLSRFLFLIMQKTKDKKREASVHLPDRRRLVMREYFLKKWVAQVEWGTTSQLAVFNTVTY